MRMYLVMTEMRCVIYRGDLKQFIDQKKKAKKLANS